MSTQKALTKLVLANTKIEKKRETSFDKFYREFVKDTQSIMDHHFAPRQTL